MESLRVYKIQPKIINIITTITLVPLKLTFMQNGLLSSSISHATMIVHTIKIAGD
jgi:hypothetical protein